jgi:hypothetical protein
MSAIRRIKDLAAGWKDSDAVLTVNAADAALLGVPVESGKQHAALTGKELYAKARSLREADDADDAATANQRAVSSPADGGKKKADDADDAATANQRAVSSPADGGKKK